MQTRRVRIPVVIGSNGGWCVDAYPGTDEATTAKWTRMEAATQAIDEAALNPSGAGMIRAWIEVDLPLPEPLTLSGAVVEGEG
mgnify:CR=1 FL=1